MQAQFQYIANLAKQYNSYSQNTSSLYSDLNALPKNAVEDIFKEYGDPERDFKPVNLLRAEVARRLLLGEVVDAKLVDLIKDKIRTKDLDYFSYYKQAFLNQL